VPLNELAVPERVVGEREVRRALNKNLLRKIFVAMDSDGKFTESFLATAAELGIEVEEVDSKLKLGRACAIDRPAAVVGLLKRKNTVPGTGI
jgi:large subunit ribosomal protein L7A